jgi:transcriptional regulator with PAS, ATPase and Fis domain
VIAATNKNLDEALAKGEIREDLYYRLNVFHIPLPALRKHKEDLLLIAQALIADLNKKHDCKVTDLHPDVVEEFRRYDWPGNVRELRNMLERAVILAGEGTILPSHFLGALGGEAKGQGAAAPHDPNAIAVPVGTTVREAEKALILRTLEHTGNNKTRAAQILEISLKTLHNKLKEYGG